MKTLLLQISVFLTLFATSLSAQNSVQLASKFIASLSEGQKKETVFTFDTTERYRFHFVPMKRNGVTFNELSMEQKSIGLDLLKSCLSDEAYQKTNDIVALEVILKELEHRKPEDHYRDPGNYHFSIFGNPSTKSIWGWRFEGHHISFHFTFNQQKMVSGTPGFLGTNPAIVLSGPEKGKQVLKNESDKGFDLLNALNASQLKKAIIDSIAYKDILTFDKRKAMLGDPVGLSFAEMSVSQQQKLIDLVTLYVRRYTHAFAKEMLDNIKKAGHENIWFSWAGFTYPEIGKGTYYRVQGPTFLIEYDNTQNNANHVHSVLRDLKQDFGGDELLEHYKMAH